MHCGSCVARVENSIRRLPGIASVSVDLKTGETIVEHQSDKVSPTQIHERIASAGFKEQIPVIGNALREM